MKKLKLRDESTDWDHSAGDQREYIRTQIYLTPEPLSLWLSLACSFHSFMHDEFIGSLLFPMLWMDQLRKMNESCPFANSYSNKESPTMMVPGLCVYISNECWVNVRVAICSTYKLGLCSAMSYKKPTLVAYPAKSLIFFLHQKSEDPQIDAATACHHLYSPAVCP